MRPTRPPSPPLRIALAVVAAFNLVSAIAGMIGLSFAGGMGVPLEWLDGTGFTSYFWPGIFLGVVVGGVQVPALAAQCFHFDVAWGLHAAAGLVMMIWIFAEVAIVLSWSPLHGIYFTTGLVQTVLAVLVLGAAPRPFLRRSLQDEEPAP